MCVNDSVKSTIGTDMKSVLLVTPYPYTLSTRGMDLLTRAFESSGWDTQHVQFPRVFYSLEKRTFFPTTVKEKKSYTVWIPYIDALMKKLPQWIFRWILRNHRRSVNNIDWNSYDLIVLESGKPLFLLDLVGERTTLVYRQSDPVGLFLGENPQYIRLENEIYEKSAYILTPKDRFRDLTPAEHRHKVSVIPNGIHIPKGVELKNPFPPGSVNAVYVGLAPLDVDTIEVVSNGNPNVTFHLFGTGVRGVSAIRLKRKKNVVIHGFVSSRIFIPYLAHATMYVFPFRRSERFENIGITSKYYMAMRFGLPIVSYPMGPAEEFRELPVSFCLDSREFCQSVKRIAAAPYKVQYDLEWDKLEYGYLLDSYRGFINTIETGRVS